LRLAAQIGEHLGGLDHFGIDANGVGDPGIDFAFRAARGCAGPGSVADEFELHAAMEGVDHRRQAAHLRVVADDVDRVFARRFHHLGEGLIAEAGKLALGEDHLAGMGLEALDEERPIGRFVEEMRRAEMAHMRDRPSLGPGMIEHAPAVFQARLDSGEAEGSPLRDVFALDVDQHQDRRCGVDAIDVGHDCPLSLRAQPRSLDSR